MKELLLFKPAPMMKKMEDFSYFSKKSSNLIKYIYLNYSVRGWARRLLKIAKQIALNYFFCREKLQIIDNLGIINFHDLFRKKLQFIHNLGIILWFVSLLFIHLFYRQVSLFSPPKSFIYCLTVDSSFGHVFFVYAAKPCTCSN